MRRAQPVIVYANSFQFGCQQRIHHPSVRSRLMLWCRAGRGRVRVNGDDRAFQPGDVWLTPWDHDIAYAADAREPFLLAGIHLIPHQRYGTPFVGMVAHRPGDLPELRDLRRDAPWPQLTGLRRGRFEGDPPLQALAEYIVRLWRDQPPREPQLRLLAGLLVAELTTFFTRPAMPRATVSLELQRVLQFIEDHLARPVYLAEAARLSGRSLSWLHRQFRQQLRTTPMDYVIAARIKRAQTLLATTSLRVGEIGQAVGVADPYYFSKLFTARVGQSPTIYRQRVASF